MAIEKFRYLAGVIAAHPNRELIARTRLQKTVRLLQRKGMPTDYGFMTHFYGPYSEDIQSDIGLLENFGLVQESLEHLSDGSPYYKLRATPQSDLPEIGPFKPLIDKLAREQTVILELAATYDAFREQGDGHQAALERVRRKKGSKCHEGRLERALILLDDLGLPSN